MQYQVRRIAFAVIETAFSKDEEGKRKKKKQALVWFLMVTVWF